MGKETDNNGPSSELKAAIGGWQCYHTLPLSLLPWHGPHRNRQASILLCVDVRKVLLFQFASPS